ncbi:unnamed protein product [Durusdinium trenchii]|uniref:USP domain-containing protein n=1 Tax=Durusdinium trenchii TaxID=1381693 RepID=A0ABP0T084_9DINO
MRQRRSLRSLAQVPKPEDVVGEIWQKLEVRFRLAEELCNFSEGYLTCLQLKAFFDTGVLTVPLPDVFKCGIGSIDDERYLLSLISTVRELERFAVGRARVLDLPSIRTAWTVAQCVEQAMLQFDFRNSGALRQRYDSLKYVVKRCQGRAGARLQKQCLSHIEPFAAFFLSGRYAGEVNEANPMGSKGQLAETFAELQKVLWQSERPAQNPGEIKRRLAKIAPHLFQGYEQQDVQEFLAFCLDGLHEDLSRISEAPPARTEAEEQADERSCIGKSEEFAAALAWMRYLERSKSFLVDLMQGQLRSCLCCMQCGHRSRKFEPFMYLSLPVTQEMSTVSDAMREYTKEEVLSGNEQWFCEKCKAKVDTKKKIDLWQLPPVLVIHLKRFEFDVRSGYFRKINTPLACDLTIDLSGFCSSTQRQGALYSVACVANHSGAYGMGHYTATCRVGDQWYKFNDERVSRQPPDEPVVGNSAYVLFLVRRSLEDGYYSAGHNSPLLKQQTMNMPELWPHQLSQDFSSLMKLRRDEPAEGAISNEKPLYVMKLPTLPYNGHDELKSDNGSSDEDVETPVCGSFGGWGGWSLRHQSGERNVLLTERLRGDGPRWPLGLLEFVDSELGDGATEPPSGDAVPCSWYQDDVEVQLQGLLRSAEPDGEALVKAVDLGLLNSIKERYDNFTDMREQVIKRSRDIGKGAKNAVYALQRADYPKAEVYLSHCAKEASTTFKDFISAAPNLRPVGFSAALEEMAEAVAYRAFLKDSRILNKAELHVSF